MVKKMPTELSLGHASGSSGLAKTILQGNTKGEETEDSRRKVGWTTAKSGQAWIAKSKWAMEDTTRERVGSKIISEAPEK